MPSEQTKAVSTILLDFGKQPDCLCQNLGWISIAELNQDEMVDIGNGLTITAVDDGFSVDTDGSDGSDVDYGEMAQTMGQRIAAVTYSFVESPKQKLAYCTRW